MRASTSASQACGSTSLSFAVMISVAMAAARSAPRSEPANSHDFLPSAKPRSARSAALFVRQIRPSSRKPAKRSQRLACSRSAWRPVAERESRARSSRSQAPDRRRAARFAPGGRAGAPRRSAPLMARSMSNSASMRFTASSAIGEIAGALLPRRALAAMSASSKNCRRACAQHSAERDGAARRAPDRRARCSRHRRRPAGCRRSRRDAARDARCRRSREA